MKDIDSKAANAFKNKRNFISKNTKVVYDGRDSKMYLFNNLIAETRNNSIWITNCGWFSITTRNRLNALGARIRKSKDEFILNERISWDGNWIKL